MKFISDMGESPVLVNLTTGEEVTLARYAVWCDEGRRKPEVIDQGDDLDALQAKHGPGLRVIDIKSGQTLSEPVAG